MGKWTNSNNFHAVTDGPFSAQICMFDPEKEIPHWPEPAECSGSARAFGMHNFPNRQAVCHQQNNKE